MKKYAYLEDSLSQQYLLDPRHLVLVGSFRSNRTTYTLNYAYAFI